MVGFYLGLYNDHDFRWETLGLVLLCMILARTAAMAFNRYSDSSLDSLNARTAGREIPKGEVSASSVLWLVVVSCLCFVVTTYFINRLCFFLSPIALIIVLGYSYTKRFTSLCHIILGLGLALAPVGAYIAVTASISWIPIVYGLIVLLWVAGFDMVYALQDESFDRQYGLHSVPVFLGPKTTILLARLLHLVVGLLIVYATLYLMHNTPSVGYLHMIGTGAFVLLLLYQHVIVSHNDLSRINQAFFLTNGFASLIFGVCFILDFYL